MTLLIKPEPFMADFDRFVNRLFDASETGSQRWVPAMDLTEAEGHFVLKADLPGMSEEDIAIEVQDGTLTISGERKAEHENREQGWHRIERQYGRFSRSLTLPEGVDPEGVNANFEQGVLSVSIPKPEERKPRRISIGVGGNGNRTLEGTAEER
jgi:HSP20 family protein